MNKTEQTHKQDLERLNLLRYIDEEGVYLNKTEQTHKQDLERLNLLRYIDEFYM